LAARDPQSDLPPGPTVGDAIGDLPDLDTYSDLLRNDSTLLEDRELAEGDRVASAYARALRGLERGALDLSRPRAFDRRLLTSSMRTRHTAVSIDRFDATSPGDVEPVSRFLRLNPGALCNTLRAGTGSERGAFTSPRPIHPLLPRVISVREAARLHSFPDWFRLHATKWHGFRQIGNSVPPLLGRAVAREIVAALGVEPVVPEERLGLGDPALLNLTMSAAALRFGADRSAIPAQRSRKVERLVAAA
jgi:DNA (cytosine-5)-methyltransferase 1